MESVEADVQGMESGIIPKTVCRYAGVIFDEIPTFLNYFSENDMIFLVEPKRIAERAKSLEWEFAEHIKEHITACKWFRDAGWEGGSLEDFFPGCSIGGDVFGNREGILPEKSEH